MEILYTSDYLILKQTQFSLWFKRFDKVTNFEFKTGIDFSKLENLKCLGIAYTLIGSLTQDSLLLTVRNQFIGQIPSDQTDLNVYLIKKVTLIDLNADLDALINSNEFDQCPVHGQITSNQNENQFTSSDNLNVQRTWNTIKNSTAGLMNNNSSFNLNFEILRMFNETDSFYYCDNGDLTNTLQRKNTSQYGELIQNEVPFWKRSDDRFFFNRHALSFLLNNVDQSQANWIIPIIQGFVQIEDCKISLEETHEFRLILISRRSRYRAGTRFKRRGVDENGRCANYVESEQILKFNNHVVSFVQVRGSIPVYWSQPGLSYRPLPILDRNLKESQQAFRKHFEEEFKLYDKVTAVSLIERNGRESILGDTYLNCVLDFDCENLTYITFDFHDKCRGMRFNNVNLLIESIQEQIKEMLFFWKDKDGVICRQSGVFRVNCVDCLDRTNLVQSAIGKFVLVNQMNKLCLLYPDSTLPFSVRKVFQSMWASNGDILSINYAGTKALKGDYTRSGERRLTGVMKDSYNSASRYYINRFKDAYRQAAIDTLLGNQINPIDLPDLTKLPDQNNNDADEDIDRVKQIIEDVKCFCIPENEIILGSWALVSTNISNEMDCILVLTKDSYYVSNYDDQRDRVTKCQCVLLEDIEKIEIGPEPNIQLFSSIKSFKQSYCVRIHYLFNSSTGYFHVFRPSSVRIFNNLAIPIKSPDDAIELLRSIIESFKVALSVKSISVPVFEGKLQSKKSKKPQTNFLFVKQINHQLHKLPTTISDNNLLRFGRNVGKNVSNQFARFKTLSFKGKFTGSTRSNINLPDVIYEIDNTIPNDLRNNSCTSLSIVNEQDTMNYAKTSLKPRLTDPSSIASSSSIALYTTEEEAERTLSSEFSSTDDLDDEDEEFSPNDDEFSKSAAILDANDESLLESCGILSTRLNKPQQRPKSETGIYSDEVDDFVIESMKKQSMNQMLNEIKRKAGSPRIQINSNQDLSSTKKNFRSSDCFLSSSAADGRIMPNLDNSVSCANLNGNNSLENRSSHQRSSLGDHKNIDKHLISPIDDQDCTRSTMDIYSTRNTKRTHGNSLNENRIKNSKSETPLNDLNELTNLTTTIGKRDLLFTNPLSGGLSKLGSLSGSFAKGVQNMNISLISRRYNKILLSNEELEALDERKNRSKSLIIEIE